MAARAAWSVDSTQLLDSDVDGLDVLSPTCWDLLIIELLTA